MSAIWFASAFRLVSTRQPANTDWLSSHEPIVFDTWSSRGGARVASRSGQATRPVGVFHGVYGIDLLLKLP
jgi:hypothetical protein